ncbi:hypothetical protein R1sor_014557 [Riccia sorocarpa]|uniref:Uncharacterized protein n=1 Tax=Riccia sorocarpa TaxID=122646 RepID=A0ABD3H9Q5_9MARC
MGLTYKILAKIMANRVKKLTPRRNWVRSLMEDGNMVAASSAHTSQMLHMIDIGLREATSNPAKMLLIAAVLRQKWSERNQKQFKGINVSLPATKLLEEVKCEIRALEGTIDNLEEGRACIGRATDSIQGWILATAANTRAYRLNIVIDQTLPTQSPQHPDSTEEMPQVSQSHSPGREIRHSLTNPNTNET